MSDKEWHGLTEALEQPEWLADARFKTPALRDRNINDRLALIQAVLLTRAASEWLQRLDEAGVPCAPVLTRNQMIEHPQILAEEIIVQSDHDQAGRVRQARSAAQFSRTPATIRRGARPFGGHTFEILRELGLSAGEIASLETDRVLATKSVKD